VRSWRDELQAVRAAVPLWVQSVSRAVTICHDDVGGKQDRATYASFPSALALRLSLRAYHTAACAMPAFLPVVALPFDVP